MRSCTTHTHTHTGEQLGAKFEERDIPEDMKAQAQEYREKLYDQIVEQDDDVLAGYFEVSFVKQ